MDSKKNLKFSMSKLIIILIVIATLVVGGTYALFLNFSVFIENGIYNYAATCFNVDYDTGEDITGDLFPSSSYTGGLSGGVSLLLDQSCNVDGYGNLYLNIEKGAEEDSVLTQTVSAHCEDSKTLKTLTNYKDESSCTAVTDAIWVTDGTALKYVVYDVTNSRIIDTDYIKTGDKKIEVLDKIDVSIQKQYDVYIWLDGNLSDNSYASQSFNGNISAEVIQVETSQASEPVLDEGMIPVIIENDGTVTTVATTNRAWYSYENKEWANVVLVTSESRDNYINTEHVEIKPSDILAYYVWIPRYKYKIWATGVSSAGNEQTIEIVFEGKDTAKSNGTAIGGYLTHPVFTFGSEELDGFWVGKFETTGDATTPTILPNTKSLRSQNVSTHFITSLNFSGGTLSNGVVTFTGNNTYGLTSTTDSHMMKNSEWGAVAYLSHSQYGINSEIYINNSSSYYTGRSGGNVGGSVNTLATQFPDSETSTNQYNSYGYYTWTGQTIDASGNIGSYASDRTLGTNASTTGNVTGVYDMSGGAWEYVMGVFSDSNGNPRSGASSSYTSGFNGLLSDDTEYTSGISFPNSKYYDLYLQTQFTGSFSTNMSLCTLETCGGHALNETAGWYSDYDFFVVSGNPWFRRGGYWVSDIKAGAFNSNYFIGGNSNGGSWRSVLIVEE